MKERPILMNGQMVRATLADQKTKTRRIIKPLRCPYGQPGDRLWVRETYGYSRQDDDVNSKERVVCYRAGYPYHVADSGVDALKRSKSGGLIQPNHYVREPDRWRPSIHMPRWASRITLEILSVKIERLQDITEEDAIAEGIQNLGPRKFGIEGWDEYCETAVDAFKILWESINGPGSWDANPWVWVVEFRRLP